MCGERGRGRRLQVFGGVCVCVWGAGQGRRLQVFEALDHVSQDLVLVLVGRHLPRVDPKY